MTTIPGTAPSDLIERLGHSSDTRAIILNADDFGMCRSANHAICELLRGGRLDSATVMVPCSWAPQALAFAAANPDVQVGVHLVLTSEWQRYRWRPLTGIGTSLTDDAGYFPADVATVERQALDEDVAAEIASQLSAALDAGVDVTHLDNHMGSAYGLETGRSFLPQVLSLAASAGLPFRLPRTIEGMGLDPSVQAVLGRMTQAADDLGVVILDRLWTHPFELRGEGGPDEERYDDVKAGFIELLRQVGPGVTEFYLHPMIDDAELRDIADYGAAKRGYEYRLLADPDVEAVLAEEGIVRVGWRDLRAVQRAGRGGGASHTEANTTETTAR